MMAAIRCVIKTPISRGDSGVANELSCKKHTGRVLRHAAAVDVLSSESGFVSTPVVHRYDLIRQGKSGSSGKIALADFSEKILTAGRSAVSYEGDGGSAFRICDKPIKYAQPLGYRFSIHSKCVNAYFRFDLHGLILYHAGKSWG